jgi:hypothetical protein
MAPAHAYKLLLDGADIYTHVKSLYIEHENISVIRKLQARV